MTEAEWLACTNPEAMLEFLRRKTNNRKFRLFASACVRRFWGLLNDPRSRDAVEVAEHFSDGLVRESALSEASDAASLAATAAEEARAVALEPYRASGETDESAGETALALELARNAADAAMHACFWVGIDAARGASFRASWCVPESDPATLESEQSDLLRDIFGNPFRPISLDPAWLTPLVVSLAQAAYDERALPSGELDPVRLAVLSDALEEAGCADEGILAHLRSPGPHVRGCWALDLVLGKE